MKLPQSSVIDVAFGFAQHTHKTNNGIPACSNLATKAAKAETCSHRPTRGIVSTGGKRGKGAAQPIDYSIAAENHHRVE